MFIISNGLLRTSARSELKSSHDLFIPSTMTSVSPTSSAPGIELTKGLSDVVLPGTIVAQLLTGGTGGKKAVVRLGPGVVQRGRSVVATKAGPVKFDVRRSKVWVEAQQRRYEPALENMVVAIVVEKHSEDYRVALHGTDTAVLPALAFEGATKRNKPTLAVGAAVFCRVTRATRNAECEVSCIEPGSSKSWVGKQTTYGELDGGTLVRVSLPLARALLPGDNAILATLGRRVPFESAVGVNGLVWLKSATVEHTVLIAQAIQKADTLGLDEWKKWASKLLRRAM